MSSIDIILLVFANLMNTIALIFAIAVMRKGKAK